MSVLDNLDYRCSAAIQKKNTEDRRQIADICYPSPVQSLYKRKDFDMKNSNFSKSFESSGTAIAETMRETKPAAVVSVKAYGPHINGK